jgi:peptidoglycan-associated lipoprotein
VIYRVALVLLLASCYGVFTGCAKQPALTQASAPAPTAPPPPPAPAPVAPPAPAPAPAAPAPPPAVVTPPPPAPAPVERAPVKDFTAAVDLRPIYFDFDKATLRPDAAAVLDANAEWLKANPKRTVLIEGHCDERGTEAYNLALGERRARAALDYVVMRGVPRSQVTIISYGATRPVCAERNEACWSQNRRAMSVVKPD